MKTIIAVMVLMLVAAQPSSGQVASVGMDISFGTFYSGLSAYGEWVSVDQDVYAWRPTGVAVGWRPYYYGRWAWTDDGWYWASDEPWAWATYHYGRWYYDDYYGWLWIPGYEWAPAWVEWRYGGDCVGWAPLGPYALFSVSYGIYYSRPWYTPYSYWSFVPYGYMTADHCWDHIYRSDYNRRYYGMTRSGGSVGYDHGRIVSRGVDRDYAERRAGHRIERADLFETRDRGDARMIRSGSRERIGVYRPNLEDRSGRGAMARPDRVRSGERTVSLDTRNIAGRLRNDAQTRNAERAESYFNENRSSRLRGEGRNPMTAPEVRRSPGDARGNRGGAAIEQAPGRSGQERPNMGNRAVPRTDPRNRSENAPRIIQPRAPERIQPSTPARPENRQFTQPRAPERIQPMRPSRPEVQRFNQPRAPERIQPSPPARREAPRMSQPRASQRPSYSPPSKPAAPRGQSSPRSSGGERGRSSGDSRRR